MNEITRNDIRRQYTNIIQLGYCDIYDLTRILKKIGYNAGIYGWNYDVFELDWNTCIITGYRTFSKGTIRLTREFIEYMDKKAHEIKENNRCNYHGFDEQMNALKNEFIDNYKNNIVNK
jgi:hypothetical protein